MGCSAPGVRFRRHFGWTSLVALVIGVSPAAAQTANLSVQQVASGLSAPIFVTAPPNDSRLFIVERGGIIKVQSAPNTTPTTFLDISSIVRTDGERGLLGMAFDPNFATNGRFYLDYIGNTGTFDTNVRRYTMADPTSTSATGSPFDTIITVAQPTGRTNHKAGWIGFRPGDVNNLYVATGDGGSSNDPDANGQNVNTNLGKILRLNVSGSGAGYTIPAGNPFAGATPGNDEIWAYGVRNPFRNSFDRLTGHFYIGDVGQATREEVDVEEATTGGRNYGWRDREGSGDNPGVAGTTIPPGSVDPVFDYVHGGSTFSPSGVSASITGGYVYRGSKIPAIQGTYFFADWVSGKIGSFIYDPNTDALVPGSINDRTAQLDPTGTLFGGFHIASFGEDGFGEMYLIDITDGEVFKLVPEPGSATATLALIALCAMRRRRR